MAWFQMILFFIPCLCNPIFINSFVVFVRLYWFEKRFQNVVQEARSMRRERTRSRTKSQAKGEHDIGREEKGVGNRKIVVLRGTNRFLAGTKAESDEKKAADESANNMEESANGNAANGNAANGNAANGNVDRPLSPTSSPLSPSTREEYPNFHRDIVFADEVDPRPRRMSNSDRMPERRPAEQHIAFVENQRNTKDKATLRIPGPRDFDRGDVPEAVEASDESDEIPQSAYPPTIDENSFSASARRQGEMNLDDHPTKKSEHSEDGVQASRFRTGLSAFKSPFQFSRSFKQAGSHGIMHLRHRTRSFGSFAATRSHERDPMPYLSWTPTIGRNSAFVDLSEEQREELGGIEYRALKTLAFILVCELVRLMPTGRN
jgi:hypothetical protein